MFSSKFNIAESCDTIKSTTPDVRPSETCLVTSNSIFNYIDETRISQKFNVKGRSFPGAKTDDIHHYLISLLNKNI